MLAAAAWAQIHVPVYTGTPLLITSGVLTQQILESATHPVRRAGGERLERPEPEPVNAGTLVATSSINYAATLAQAYPLAQRAQAQRLFEGLLASYRSIESQFGIPRYHLAGATAAFLAGSYMAYRDADFPDAKFPPLVAQMRSILANNAQFATARTEQKREMYEQMAILGMFMATTQMALKRQPDATLQLNLREAARGYLEKLLRVDAHRVQLTATGLRITDASGGAGSNTAPPTAPAGWRLIPGTSAATYRPADAPAIELQLLPAESSTASLSTWFDLRIRSASLGLADVEFGPAQTPGQGILMAAGVAPGAVSRPVVVALACEDRRGQKQLALLRLPADPAQLQRHAEPAASVVAAACRSVPPQQAGEALATPPRTAPAGQPAERSFRVPPQRALREGDVAGVLYAWRQVFEVTGLEMHEWTYLLMKDGSARRGVPARAPADFDLVADRQARASDWGRWRRKGALIEVDFGEGFTEPPQQLLRLQGRAGERLNGRFETSASGSVAPGSSHWSSWGVHLKSDGSFTRFSSGGMGGTTGAGDRTVVTQTRRDDRGSVAAVGGANAAGSVSRSSGVGDDELQGSYRIDGWTLRLQYRSGRQEQMFFYTDETRQNLWFDGKELAAPRQK